MTEVHSVRTPCFESCVLEIEDPEAEAERLVAVSPVAMRDVHQKLLAARNS